MGGPQSEVIVNIGAEGGDLTLFGICAKSGWRPSREVIDQSALMLGEVEIKCASEIVDSWDDTLWLLDRVPWYRLHPQELIRNSGLPSLQRLRNVVKNGSMGAASIPWRNGAENASIQTDTFMPGEIHRRGVPSRQRRLFLALANNFT